MKKILDRLKKDAYRSFSDDKLRIQIQFRWVLKILLVFILAMAVLNLISGNYLMATILAALSLSYYICYWIVYKLKDRGSTIVTIIMNVEIFILCNYLMITGMNDGFSIVWVMILPITAVLLTGQKAGTICFCHSFLLMLFYFWTPLGRSLLQYPYSPVFMQRFPLILLTMFVIISFFETLRTHTLEAYREERRKTERLYARQYDNLSEKIKQARRVRHDTRHHFVMLNSYLDDGKIDEAKEYIHKYYDMLPFEEALTYCDHYGTNALLTYYAQRSRERNIPCDIKVSFPAKLPIPDEDLTIVFGNLLENAFDASEEGLLASPDFAPSISVKGSYQGNMLLFSVENNTFREAKMVRNNLFASSKHSGNGIGIDSVSLTAQRHDGNLIITQDHGVFRAKVYMM